MLVASVLRGSVKSVLSCRFEVDVRFLHFITWRDLDLTVPLTSRRDNLTISISDHLFLILKDWQGRAYKIVMRNEIVRIIRSRLI